MTTATEVQSAVAGLGRALPQTMSGFARLHAAAMVEGALGASTKELLALAISIAQGCGGCIAYHGERALDAGATRDEFLDAVGVAVLMAGGPGTVYATQALDVLESHQG
jgi:AhpD family alkylhydroperoxidase